MNLFQQEDTSTFVQRFMKTCGLPFLLVLVEISSQLKQQKQFGSSVRTSSHRESSLLQPLHIWDKQIFHTCDSFLGNIEHMPTSVSHSGRPSLFSTGWLARFYVPDSSETSWVWGLQGWGVWCEFLGSSKKTEDAVIKDDDKNES